MNTHHIKQSARLLLAAVFWGMALLPAFGAVPSLINFQGKLLDTNNVPRNGSFSMTFRICDTLAASCASPVWTETQGSVTVTNGVFSVQLGASSALNESVFDESTRYLEVEIGGETASTRQQLVTSPYAFRANVADDLDAGNTSYIRNSSTLQSGATFYVSSGTVSGSLTVGGIIVAGSGQHAIKTSAGQLNDTKLSGGSTHYIQNSSSLQ